MRFFRGSLSEPGRGRKVFAALLLNLILFSLVGATFYYQDLRYARPTPVPQGYVPPSKGVVIPVGEPGKLTLLCFAQPDCPCTRFNQDHLEALANEFGSKVKIVEVVEAADAGGLRSPGTIELDPSGFIAKQCGVYSTPQAVILGPNGQILYRGNFNAGRYCANSATEFVRIALEALVSNQPVPIMPQSALVPYGCAIGSWGASK